MSLETNATIEGNEEKHNPRFDLVTLTLLKPKNVSSPCVCDRKEFCKLYSPTDWYCTIEAGFHYGTDTRGKVESKHGCFRGHNNTF